MSRLEKTGLRLLDQAYKESKGRSRRQDKALGVDSRKIYAERSLEAHASAWKQVAEWASKNGVKNLKQLTAEKVEQFIREKAESGGRDGQGATAKTLKGYLGAVNKVMQKAELWEPKERMELSKLDIKTRTDRHAGYKKMTADEWRKANPETYERYQDTLDTIRAFGLRAQELEELNKFSIFQDTRTGRLCVQTIGKGGKFRVAECRKDMVEQMTKLHGDHIRKLDGSKLTQERLERDIKNKENRLDMLGANSHRLPKHIFRADYAKGLLTEKLEEHAGGGGAKTWVSYRQLDSMPKEKWADCVTTVGSWTGSALAFLEVSRALGHNRLDVLLKYVYA